MKNLLNVLLKVIVIFALSLMSNQTNAQTEKKTKPVDLNNRYSIENYIKTQSNGKMRSHDSRLLLSNSMDYNYKGIPFKIEFENYNSKKSEKLNGSIAETGWSPIGLDYYPPSYDERSGHGIGRINCMAVHPTNPNIVWIGSAGGGVWKTIDGGQNWAPLTDDFPNLGVSSLCVNPKNPDEVIILTGDFDGSGSNRRRFVGVYKSTDGGTIWQLLVGTDKLGSSQKKKILINPDNPEIILISGADGIWTSTNSGVDWANTYQGFAYDIEFNPINPDTVYAGIGSYYGQGNPAVLKSIDKGISWTELPINIPTTSLINRVDIEISTADPNYMYFIGVSGNTNGSNSMHSFYSSTDGGQSWSLKAQPSNNLGYNPLGAYDGDSGDLTGQGSYDLVLLADPIDKNKVYVGGVNLWMSTNQGKDWEIVSFWVKRFGDNLHADQHYAYYNQTDQKYYFCNDGGIYRTSQILPGSRQIIKDWMDHETEDVKEGFPGYIFPTQWENLTSGLVITEFYRMGLCKNNAGYAVGGAQDNACFYMKNSEWINYVPNYDGMESLIDNNDPNIIYGVWQNGGLCKSTDGGKTVQTKLTKNVIDNYNEYGQWITPLVMDPNDGNTLYMGYTNIYRSTDAGINWEMVYDRTVNPSEPINASAFELLKMSYTSSDKIAAYKATTYYLSDDYQTFYVVPGELWLTDDKGANWRKVTSQPAFDTMDINWIEYDRFNPDKMWVVVNSGNANINLFRSDDAGFTWYDDSKTMPDNRLITCMVRDLNQVKNGLYIGTSSGIFFTNDDLTTFEPFSENLPNVYIYDMEIQTQTAELFTATFGRGMWKTSIPDYADVSEDIINYEMNISPNPTNGKFRIDFSNSIEPMNNNVKISIMNTSGKTVYTEDAILDSKVLKKSFALNLNSGVYYLILNLEGKNYVRKFVVVD